MTRRATVTQADVRRAVKGALSGGLPAGSFSVEVVDGTIRLLPVAANAPLNDADEAERRMREAFGR